MRNSKNTWTRLCLAVAAALALFSLAAFAAAGTAMAAAAEEAVPETAAAPAAEEPAVEANQAVPHGSGEDAAASMAEETADSSSESDVTAEASAGAEVPSDEGIGPAAQSSASSEAEEAPASAKSAPAAAESVGEDDGASAREDASGILAADNPAAPAPRAVASNTTRVYLYIYLESLPKDVQNYLSWHRIDKGTTWVTVGYIDVPTNVLPAASSKDQGKGYVFHGLYEPLIASGSTVKYPISYYTPTYGKGMGTRVDLNEYYKQIESYIDWNHLGLCVANGASDYSSETGYGPSWHLDGYYNYSEVTLKVEKSVTGNFGDKARQYGFTAFYVKPDGTSQTVDFTLSDGESRLITVPTRTRITVTEDDYSGDDYGTTVTYGGTTTDGRTWSTDALDDNTTIVFTNHREIGPDVGIDLSSAPYLAILAGASAFGALFLIRFRRAQR